MDKKFFCAKCLFELNAFIFEGRAIAKIRECDLCKSSDVPCFDSSLFKFGLEDLPEPE
jgi:hypothetical protein